MNATQGQCLRLARTNYPKIQIRLFRITNRALGATNNKLMMRLVKMNSAQKAKHERLRQAILGGNPHAMARKGENHR